LNSTWNKNLSLFKNRFPELAKAMEKQIDFFEKTIGSQNEKELLYPFWEVFNAKNGDITAKENSIQIHSAYNP